MAKKKQLANAPARLIPSKATASSTIFDLLLPGGDKLKFYNMTNVNVL